MHRKSAYILFLAVLGLLVIGIVMLFSTSAFARDSHGDVYFFVKRQAIWLGVGLVVCICGRADRLSFLATDLVDLVCARGGRARALFVPHIGMRINGSRRWIGSGPDYFSTVGTGEACRGLFSRWWFARYEKASRNILL